MDIPKSTKNLPDFSPHSPESSVWADIEAGSSVGDQTSSKPKKNFIEKVSQPISRALRGKTHQTEDAKKKVVTLKEDGKPSERIGQRQNEKSTAVDISEPIKQCRSNELPYLDISSHELTFLPNNALADLSFLQQLFLYKNKLTTLPAELGNLTNLRDLMIHQNVLTAAGFPPELSRLRQLNNLDFRHNRVEGNLPEFIYSLENLEELLGGYNKINQLDDRIANLKKLKNLVLNNNGPELSLSPAIGQLSNLCQLDLSHCKMVTLPDSISNCLSLEHLNLQHNQLASLPESLGDLVKLQRLILKYNQLAKLPDSLCRCVHLEDFSLESNKLADLPHNLFAEMTALQKAELSRNAFVEIPSGESDAFAHITTLHFDHNRIGALSAEVMLQAKRLKTLVMRDNELRSLDDFCLHTQACETLVELDCGSNQLTDLPEEIGRLAKLRILRLPFNRIESLPVELGQLESLELLDLEANRIAQLPDSLDSLKSLQELNLASNLLTALPPSIGSLAQLRVLKASENELEEIPLELGNLKQLTSLYLFDNPRLDNLPAELSGCTKLSIMDVKNCPLSKLPDLIVDGGSAMIIYFLQQVVQLRQQHNATTNGSSGSV